MFPACRCVRCVGSFKSDRPYFDHNLASHDRPNRFILPVCSCVLEEEHVLRLFPSPSLSCSLKIILSFATFSADLHGLSLWLKTAVHYDLLHALAAHPHPPPPSSCPLLRSSVCAQAKQLSGEDGEHAAFLHWTLSAEESILDTLADPCVIMRLPRISASPA